MSRRNFLFLLLVAPVLAWVWWRQRKNSDIIESVSVGTNVLPIKVMLPDHSTAPINSVIKSDQNLNSKNPGKVNSDVFRAIKNRGAPTNVKPCKTS